MELIANAGIIRGPGLAHPPGMAEFPLHTRATAPFEAKPFLDQAGQSIGYVPALLAQMAEAPALLEGYAALGSIFRKSALSPLEQQLVLLTVSVEHQSRYCTPAHAAKALAVALDEAAINAVRDSRPIDDPRREALRAFTIRMIQTRGELAPDEVDAFIAAGFTRANALEIILAIGLKTLSTYVTHIAQTPLDPPRIADALTVGRRVA
jgi:alkylhydroperoxidase family enzyme